MKLLEGKVAIVTGAARGIGKAIALKLASEGANIAFTDLNIDENALATEKEIEEWAGKLLDDESTKYPIYRDPEANLAKLYNIPDGYSFHGQTVHYPALIVLDTEGNELFRYIGKNNTDRFSFDQLGDKMKEFTELKSMKK